MKPFQDITDPALAKALAHPLRTRILAALEGRTASPSELAEELDAPLGVLSYHVRRLEALKLVKLVKRVPRRGAVEHYYSATARPRITSATWAKTPSIVKEATVRAAVDQIFHYVTDAASMGGFDGDESHLTRLPVALDAKGWQAIAHELDSLHERIKKIEAESQKRLVKANHEDEQHATAVLMLFNSPSEAPAAAPSKRTAAGGRSATRTASRRS
jgi:DNA-binding transcriptional ArsR family regulator